MNQNRNFNYQRERVQGLNGSYIGCPTIRVVFKDGRSTEIECWHQKEQIDVTNHLKNFIELLESKGLKKLELKANRGLISDLEKALDLISRIKYGGNSDVRKIELYGHYSCTQRLLTQL